MIVTFISQCEKKALNKTRRVLDAFANRIGSNTWQTVITNEGLNAVKKLLRKTATKNTAVSCHWIRSRSRIEFIWSVGNKDKFNNEGIVPVNYTQEEGLLIKDESHWKNINTIALLSSIAGLFHDFGKANQLFQDKLNPKIKGKSFEPYRHEWLSFRLFQAFVGNKADRQWLEELSDLPKDAFSKCFRDGIDRTERPQLSNLAPLAKLVAWLIVTHHKLPLYPAWKTDKNRPPCISEIESWLKSFKPFWNSYNCEDADQKERLPQNWEFHSLPNNSSQWRSKACTLASEALSKLHTILDKDIDWLHEQLFTTHLSRLCLILADHYYSSLTLEQAQEQGAGQWRNKQYKVYANTHWVDDKKQHKQQLDEHLTGVAHHARKIALALPKLNHKLASLKLNDALSKNIPSQPKILKDNFGWQDHARKLAEKIGKDTLQQGFFGINMASTGKGKTRANAKIMAAIGKQAGRVRFSVALGLRVLTLQTGKEFQKELGLSEEELAIAVGGIAVKQLFENQQQQNDPTKINEKSPEENGSQSNEEWLDKDMSIHYAGKTQHNLLQWTKKQRGLDSLLAAPVLVSTIDHLIPATEGTKGGKQIPATLRLLTSDLVLDEPDDFGLSDLPALCRLVHWAGMLGSRVLLSTATIPPSLANALFQSYWAGWSEFAKANLNNGSKKIICAWFDEQKDPKKACIYKECTPDTFNEEHEHYVKNRVKYLNTLGAKRKGDIIKVVKKTNQTTAEAIANTIHGGIVSLHHDHSNTHNEKSLSVGLIRMANINPLITVAKELFKKEAPENTFIHYCIYHSRYPLAIRSFIENNLDRILNRKEQDPEKPTSIWQQKEITQAIEKHPKIKHHIFVVIASPVAEVGRDHDYDWAIVEPSSMRSIIQLAGRVLRHRDEIPSTPNILILNKNYKALDVKELCFERPGFESKSLKMTGHDLLHILNKEQFQNITAIQRIYVPKKYCENDKCLKNLALFEQRALANQLFMGTNPAKVWWNQTPHWCGEVQRQQRFRNSQKDEAYYLWVESDSSPIKWQWKNESISPAELTTETPNPIHQIDLEAMASGNQFWFNQREINVYQQLANDFNMSLKQISERFGEVRLTEYNTNQQEYSYHPYLGIFEQKPNNNRS